MIELHPKRGIDALRFGDQLATAVKLFGEGQIKDHPGPIEPLKSMRLADLDLLLYFNDRDQLTLVCAPGSSETVSLLGDPLSSIFKSRPYGDAIKTWASLRNLTISKEKASCLGTFDIVIESLGLTFVLGENDGGVQASP